MENILGYYLMPHPPIIIPEIGLEKCEILKDTTLACDKIGKEISKLNPDTVVVINSQGKLFQKVVTIYNQKSIYGDFSEFRCADVNMNIEIDTEFCKSIYKNCSYENIPINYIDETLSNKCNMKFEMHHGTMVPLYFVNKHLQNYKLVEINYGNIGQVNLYNLGNHIRKIAEKLNKKIVMIASDYPLIEEKKDLYFNTSYGKKVHNEFLKHVEKAHVIKSVSLDDRVAKELSKFGLDSLNILLGAMGNIKIDGELMSYERPFGVGYGVMKFKKIK